MWSENLGFVSEAALTLGVGPVASDHFAAGPPSRGLVQASLDGPPVGTLRIGDGLCSVVTSTLEPLRGRCRSVRARSLWQGVLGRRGSVDHRPIAHPP